MFANPNAQNYTHVLISTNVLKHIALSTPVTTIDAKTLAESIVPFAPLNVGPMSAFGNQPMQHPNGPCFGQHSIFNPGQVFGPGGIFNGNPSGFPTASSVGNQYPQYDQSRTPGCPIPAWNPAGTTPKHETKSNTSEDRSADKSSEPCQKQHASCRNTFEPKGATWSVARPDASPSYKIDDCLVEGNHIFMLNTDVNAALCKIDHTHLIRVGKKLTQLFKLGIFIVDQNNRESTTHREQMFGLINYGYPVAKERLDSFMFVIIDATKQDNNRIEL